MSIRIDLNEPQIIQKVTSDKFGLRVSEEWKRLIDPYTPKDTGFLMGIEGGTVDFLPFGIHYKENYARYMYRGIVYVDPIFHCSGFLDKDGHWKSRKYVDKIPSNRKFKYQKKNDHATDHWDIKAAEAGQLDKLYTTLNDALQNNKI